MDGVGEDEVAMGTSLFKGRGTDKRPQAGAVQVAGGSSAKLNPVDLWG